MKTLFLAIISICTLICCESCTGPSGSPIKQDSSTRIGLSNSLTGKLYLFAPEFDSTNLVATGECDCCSANIAFTDDSHFLNIEYCEDGSSYTMGKYQLDDSTLMLNFDSVTVEKYFPDLDDSSGAKSPRVIYHLTINKPETKIYKRQEFRGVTLFLHNEFGAPDKENKFNELLNTIRGEGIMEKLNTNPALIVRNTPAVEVFLRGVWAAPDELNASFKILEDSIYYTDQAKSYPYKLENDSLKIEFDHFVSSSLVVMKGSDTLILNGTEKQVFYRFNK